MKIPAKTDRARTPYFPPPNPYPVRLTSLSGCVSRLRYRGPSVYRTDSPLIRSPAGVERTAGPPPRVWASVPRLPPPRV